MSVYFIKDGARIKIGYSAEIEKRVNGLLRGLPAGAEYLGYIPGRRDVERHFHALFRRHRLEGEWFEVTARLTDLISEIALPHFPGSEVASSADRLRDMDQKFADEASEAIANTIRELRADEFPLADVVGLLAPAIGLTPSRFLAIKDCEVESITAAEYTQIMRSPALAKSVEFASAYVRELNLAPEIRDDPPPPMTTSSNQSTKEN